MFGFGALREGKVMDSFPSGGLREERKPGASRTPFVLVIEGRWLGILLQAALRQAGMVVLQAASLQEARALVCSANPDLVLGGWDERASGTKDIVAQLKREYPTLEGTPVIIMRDALAPGLCQADVPDLKSSLEWLTMTLPKLVWHTIEQQGFPNADASGFCAAIETRG